MRLWRMSLAVAALCAVAACSKPAGGAAAAGNATEASATAAAPDKPLDCAKLFTPADVAGVIVSPAAVTPYTLRERSCSFDGAGGGAVHVYADSGVTSELGWNDASHNAKYTALPGVGDGAVWRTEDSSELLAKKGDAYCSVGVLGLGQHPGAGDDYTKITPAGRAALLGALCKKVFAAG